MSEELRFYNENCRLLHQSVKMVKIVITGHPKSGKKTLLKGLQHLEQHGPSPSDSVWSEQRQEGSVLQQTWNLSTKYYTAEITVELLPGGEFFHPTEVASNALEGAEAVIICNSVGRSMPEFHGLAAWSDLVKKHDVQTLLLAATTTAELGDGADGAGADEELLLGSEDKPSSLPSSPFSGAVWDYIRDWTLDNGFELVECAPFFPLQGSAGKEKSSVARVLEALQSTMWSNMERKAAPAMGRAGALALARGAGVAAGGAGGAAMGGAGGAAAALPAALASAGAAETKESEKKEEETKKEEKKEEKEADTKDSVPSSASPAARADLPLPTASAGPAAAVAVAVAAAVAAAAAPSTTSASKGSRFADPSVPLAELLESVSASELAEEMELDASKSRGAAAGAGGEAEGAGEGEEEEEDADIGAMMEQMRAVRQAAQEGGISDEARRDAAAAMAMKLFALLGGDMLGEDDEEEEEQEEKKPKLAQKAKEKKGKGKSSK